MHRVEEIRKNQKDFKEEIEDFFLSEYIESQKTLKNLKPIDGYISSQKEKLLKKFEKAKVREYLGRLFFVHPHRNKKFYIWWDEENSETKILKYGQRQKGH